MMAKVCGLTTRADALHAKAQGADFLGFVDYPPSPRHCVDIAHVAQGLGEHGVLVTVSDDAEKIIARAKSAGLCWVQPYVSVTSRAQVLQVLRTAGLRVLLPWPDAPGNVDLPADLYVWETSPSQTGVHGGSGQAHAMHYPPPGAFLLAGGVDGETLHQPLHALISELRARCKGVDAASRLESSPGHKCPAAVSHFIRTAHAFTF